MKKLLITNNCSVIKKNFDEIYTDSPSVIEYCNNAKYLDSFLDPEHQNKIIEIKKKGLQLNKKIVKEFFPQYNDRNVEILDVDRFYTNIFTNTYKLIKLINFYPDYEITIAVSKDELYDYNSPNTLDRFVNIYYWIAKIAKLKNIKLTCENSTRFDLYQDHLPMDSWFLRLIDLDKKVLFFNFLKKINLIKIKQKKIYVYKWNTALREIEPYLYDLGFSYVYMPKIKTYIDNSSLIFDEKKIELLVDKFFGSNEPETTFKLALAVIYKKRVKYYLNKELIINDYILKLDKNIKIIITNSIYGFDRFIFLKKLQDNGHKFVNIMHGLTASYRTAVKHLKEFKCSDIDMLLCFNKSEEEMYKKNDPDVNVYPISSVQEAKKPRLNKIKRFIVARKLKIRNEKNVFYVSTTFPLNNNRVHQTIHSDEFNYNFEKKMINLLSSINKKVIYKTYPRRNYIDPSPMCLYAKKFDNIKVVDGNFDFRYVNSIGDIFILTSIGFSSTITWLINLNKPIIFLLSNENKILTEDSINMLRKIFIVVDREKQSWQKDLKSILNKSFKELKKIWDDKQVYRDKYDVEWLTDKNAHSGKLGAKYIKDLFDKTFEKIEQNK